MEKGAKLVVMACNSASSVAANPVTERFDLPLFEVITPAVDLSLTVSKNYRICIIGTRATVNSCIYDKKIKGQHAAAQVFSVACPLLVPMVEEGWLKKPETRMIVKKYRLL